MYLKGGDVSPKTGGRVTRIGVPMNLPVTGRIRQNLDIIDAK
jgi:hypothetical protein